MPALGEALGEAECSMEAGVALVPGGGLVLQQGVAECSMEAGMVPQQGAAWPPMPPSAAVAAPSVGVQALRLRPSCSSAAPAVQETLLPRSSPGGASWRQGVDNPGRREAPLPRGVVVERGAVQASGLGCRARPSS